MDPSVGLSRDDAAARRALYGSNRVSPPLSCPSWVCCLLPCLLRTATMQSFHAALPREAVVRRKQQQQPAGKKATRTLRMDAASLVFGDVVELRAGDLVPADMRVLECSTDCVVDQSTLAADDDAAASDLESGGGASSLIRKLLAAADERDHADPLRARNVLLMASRVVRGTALGVVVCTGDRTFWGQLLAKRLWPVPSTSKRAGRVDKYSSPEEHRLMGGDGDGDGSKNKASPRRELIV